MTVATIFCWAAWIAVSWTINPEITNWLGFLLFYLSLFLALVGTAAILGFSLRFIGLRHQLASQSVKTAFRQAIFIAFLVVAVLFLLAQQLLTWLNLILLVAGLSFLEFFLLSYRRQPTLSRQTDLNKQSEKSL